MNNDRNLQAVLADELNSTIGAQTRLYFVQITDIDRIEDGDVAAYSQALGNIKVYTGENRWLTVGDRVYVTKIAASDKYIGYYFVGWQSNASNRNPGSILAFDPTNVASVAALPAAAVARQNQIKLVNGVPYHYTDGNGWKPFGSRPRQYVWYLPGEIESGSGGALVQLDHPSTLTGVVLACDVAPTSQCLVDIQVSANLSSWATVFAVRPFISTGGRSGGVAASFSTAALAAGTWIRCVVITTGAVAGLTVQLRMTT